MACRLPAPCIMPAERRNLPPAAKFACRHRLFLRPSLARERVCLRLHGGVVTQRIANPLSPIENIRFFLAKTALGGRNGARTCKTFAAGAAALALAGCGVLHPSEEAVKQGAEFGGRCAVARPSAECERRCDAEFHALAGGSFYQSESRRACLLAVYAAAPDPAPELAGAREAAP